ncbi:MAG: class I SAM-dependent RNA methyltransferase [Myxococcales bacterium]|nr:class I SAM-dependent RNA methyltransferase [Myxococcales bacterium]
MTLTDLAAGGEAVGRLADGRVVFVPGGVSGDEVEVSLDELRKGYVRGTLRAVLSPSPLRQTPVCALSVPGRCGGCPIMHVARTEQLDAKARWVSRAVRHSGAQVLPILSPTTELGYRLRARLGVISVGNQLKLSFSSARSSDRQPLDECPVLDPRLSDVLFHQATSLAALIGSGGFLSALVGHQTLQSTAPRPVHLSIESGPQTRRNALRKELERLIAQDIIVGAIVDEETLGQPTVDLGDDLGSLPASADGFAQASAPGHSQLPRWVADALRPGLPHHPTILELYAGSGNLTRALLSLGGHVLAVEGEPRAAARLQALSEAASTKGRLTVRPLSVEKALPQIVKEGPGWDAIVLDPPRGGARSIVPLLGTMTASKLVYVSCDAMTLGRDLVDLAGFGFRPRTVQPIDLMPHTAEVECIAVLER